jgi:hypothetical protein
MLTAAFLGLCLIIVGVIVFGIEGYHYVASLYHKSSPDGKLATVFGIVCVFLGASIGPIFNEIRKRFIAKN